MNTQTGAISHNESLLIRPTQSTVGTFCTELTTITQDMLNSEGISFEEACNYLRENYKQYPWASYGAYDIRMMQSQCKKRGIEYPLSDDHINVKVLFTEKKGLNKPTGMAGALYILEIPLEGTHHRGVDDAKNIAKVLYWCLKN